MAISKESAVENFRNENASSMTKHNISELAHDAGTKVRKLFDSASHELSHATDAVTEQMRSKPLQSSLIVLATGFVLGMLFRR